MKKETMLPPAPGIALGLPVAATFLASPLAVSTPTPKFIPGTNGTTIDAMSISLVEKRDFLSDASLCQEQRGGASRASVNPRSFS
jgi:hypothetical protein